MPLAYIWIQLIDRNYIRTIAKCTPVNLWIYPRLAYLQRGKHKEIRGRAMMTYGKGKKKEADSTCLRGRVCFFQ